MIPDGDQQTNDGATHNKNVDKSNKLSTNYLEEILMGQKLCDDDCIKTMMTLSIQCGQWWMAQRRD